jgi:hypothetical protein
MPPPGWLEAVERRAPRSVAVWRTLDGEDGATNADVHAELDR